MRILVCILALAILLGGYSAAAHAFDAPHCVESEAPAPDKNTDSSPQKDTPNQHVCTACHHGCAPHADLTAAMDLQISPVRNALAPPPQDIVEEGGAVRLKRPPKTLA